jgi:hypothetical protein
MVLWVFIPVVSNSANYEMVLLSRSLLYSFNVVNHSSILSLVVLMVFSALMVLFGFIKSLKELLEMIPILQFTTLALMM